MINVELEEYKKKQHSILGEFLHELKTPLTIIRSHLEVEIPNDEIPLGVRQKLVMDVEEVVRLTQLVEQMKVLLSCEYQDGKSHFKNASLLTLLVDTIEILEALAQQKGQKISLIAVENIEHIIHYDKCKQLFYNLINNAIKYTPDGGSIEVSLKQTEDSIVVAVKDDGCGIAADEQASVFKQFYRTQNTASQDGLGLGLALSQAIVTMHGASLSLESELGFGSTLSVNFPKKEQ
ncbi:sensor histidine kinase KdpD [Sulfurimonas sp.]|jgi:signal transduction histidine kinase|uniref:sensor histidine kinase n=1 Tax=Sulfurimonas sp. TaxID=2022749 RepID=UPI0025E87D60|nr:HAMP domain-containing sensor histidine kinase [Sulfurimonas sp.]MBT5933843.1 HAMP domain-containing histidine kinase [Sulfurimonas sp.]